MNHFEGSGTSQSSHLTTRNTENWLSRESICPGFVFVRHNLGGRGPVIGARVLAARPATAPDRPLHQSAGRGRAAQVVLHLRGNASTVTQAEPLGLLKKVIVPSVLNSSVRVWGVGGDGGASQGGSQ
jgi:hypothetical protein